MSVVVPPVVQVLRTPQLPRDVAMRLAAQEYERVLHLLQSLSPADWSRPTCCSAWDVHAMVSHSLGMAEFAASLPEQLRQLLRARRTGGVFIDALTALQVAKHSGDSPAELVRAFADIGPRASRGRRRTPGVVRNRRMPVPQAVGGVDEDWSLGFLVDVILTRDPWMHRLDLCLAVGAEALLTAGHDGVMVDDVVREWASRHGQACRLELSGPAGGSWTYGEGGPLVELEASSFCRLVAGRGEGSGLLTQQVAF